MQKSKLSLKNSFGPAMSINLVLIAAYLGVNLVSVIAVKYLESLLPYSAKYGFEPWSTVTAVVVGAAVSFFYYFPLKLSVKEWYLKLLEKEPPLSVAFRSFTSARRYLATLFFSAGCAVIRFLTVFMLLVFPAILTAVLQSGFELNHGIYGIGGMIVVLNILLYIAAAIFSLYFLVGFSLADYIFLKGVCRRPIAALRLSTKIVSENSSLVFSTIISLIPYFLASLLIITLPFTLVKIRAAYAAMAESCIDKQISAKGENNEKL